MARDLQYSIDLYAKACKACAEECAKQASHHETCKECAEACA